MIEFPVCKECKRKTKTQKDTCCQMLFEAKYPLKIDWLKPYTKWSRK